MMVNFFHIPLIHLYFLILIQVTYNFLNGESSKCYISHLYSFISVLDFKLLKDSSDPLSSLPLFLQYLNQQLLYTRHFGTIIVGSMSKTPKRSFYIQSCSHPAHYPTSCQDDHSEMPISLCQFLAKNPLISIYHFQNKFGLYDHAV